MSDQVFIYSGGQQVGPYTVDQLQALAGQRQVTPDMLCWREGLSEWTALGAVYPILFQAAPAAVPTPAPVPAPVAAAAPAPAAGPSKVEWEVLRKEFWVLPKVTIENAEVVLEAGALHYMRGRIEIEAKLPSVGGLLKAKLTGERAVRPRYRGTGEIYLEPTFAEVNILDLAGSTWILDKGAFLACESTVEVGMFTNKAISGLFGGEGFFQTQVSGHGKVLYVSPGPLEALELFNDTLVVDGSFAVARTGGLEFTVERSTKGLFGSMASGEGLVNRFTGTGTVMIAAVPNRFLTLQNEFGGLRHLISRIKS